MPSTHPQARALLATEAAMASAAVPAAAVAAVAAVDAAMSLREGSRPCRMPLPLLALALPLPHRLARTQAETKRAARHPRR
mmetsp:Transcript_73028/g.237485  ORF Transcript_73028/g.237485 Transcript_73028/m.237485 type:complete len:81 (-) Transcript_73028:816-1058(-)